MTDRELMQQALEALENVQANFGEYWQEVIEALRERLAREEQAELANLHSEAILSSPSLNRTPSLWKAENRKPKESNKE